MLWMIVIFAVACRATTTEATTAPPASTQAQATSAQNQDGHTATRNNGNPKGIPTKGKGLRRGRRRRHGATLAIVTGIRIQDRTGNAGINLRGGRQDGPRGRLGLQERDIALQGSSRKGIRHHGLDRRRSHGGSHVVRHHHGAIHGFGRRGGIGIYATSLDRGNDEIDLFHNGLIANLRVQFIHYVLRG